METKPGDSGPGRRRTTDYLQQENLEPKEFDELASRIYDEVRRICQVLLQRDFPRLKWMTRRTEVAGTALMRMRNAWKGFHNHAHFTNAVFDYARYVLIDMTRGLATNKGQERLRQVSLEALSAERDAESNSDEAQPLDGILQAEEHQWLNDSLSYVERERPDLAPVLAFSLAGLTQQEMADRLCTTPYKIRKLLHEVTDVLIERIPPDWLDS